jgi:hypothetical protein
MWIIEFDSPAGHKTEQHENIDSARAALIGCKRNGFTSVTVNGQPVTL